jgi:7-cyano-7-deazaguanine synthase
MKAFPLDSQGALVLFSGGQDSTTCLAWALERFGRVETVGFDYGQNHVVEMTVREHLRGELGRLNAEWGRRLHSDHVHYASVIADVAQAALTGQTRTLLRSDGLPETFVPGRNLVFLTLAAALAYRRGLRHIVTGVCETDYSGYPDCRNQTIQALQSAINLGTGVEFLIDTPLMWIDKAQTWAMAAKLGGEPLVELIRTGTHTCYCGDRTIEHEWGFGCGECPACQLRANGWREFSAELLNS